MDAPTDPPPRGFVVATEDGGCVIRYRTHGQAGSALFLAVWLGLWTLGCSLASYDALLNPAGVNCLLLLVLIPFWGALLLVAGYAAWHFGSVTRFTFGPEELAVEQSFWRFSRRHRFRRSDVTAVRQFKVEQTSQNTFASWGLVVIGQAEVCVLSRQPLDKSSWLGPIIAHWAGVAFEPWKPFRWLQIDKIP